MSRNAIYLRFRMAQLWTFGIIASALLGGISPLQGAGTAMQRIYSEDPVQLTQLQFRDLNSGEIIRTVDLQSYDPFPDITLPIQSVDSTQYGVYIGHKVSDVEHLPTELGQALARKYAGSQYPKAIGGLARSREVTVSPQNTWIVVTYEYYLFDPNGAALVDVTKMIVFNDTGHLYWDLGSMPYTISAPKFTHNDSLLTYSYTKSLGFIRVNFDGIIIQDVWGKQTCYEYHQNEPPEYMMSRPVILDNKVLFKWQTFSKEYYIFTIVDCAQSRYYRKRYARTELPHGFKIQNDGIVVFRETGDTFDRYRRDFQTFPVE